MGGGKQIPLSSKQGSGFPFPLPGPSEIIITEHWHPEILTFGPKGGSQGEKKTYLPPVDRAVLKHPFKCNTLETYELKYRGRESDLEQLLTVKIYRENIS